MTAYPDNFNRADGALGGNWVAPLGHVAIVGGQAKSDAYAYAYPSDYSENGDQDHYIVVPVAAGVVKQCALWIRYDMDNGHALRAYISMIAGSVHVAAGVNWSSFISTVNWDSNGTYPDPSLTVRLKTVGTIMTLYVNGSEVGTWDWQGYSFSGALVLEWIEADAVIDALDAAGGASASMEIAPDPLWIGGGPCLITATGTGTDWTDGGSPSTTFSADHGEVEVYRWVSATEWELVYTPAEYIGTITFSETQYGLSDQVNGVLTPPEEGSNGLCQLTPAGALVVNRAGLQTPDGAVLTTDTVLGDSLPGNPDLTILDGIGDLLTGFYIYHIPGMTYTLGEAIDKLWLAVNGSVDLTGAEIGDQTNDSLNSMLTALRLLFYDDETFTDITLKQLLTAIEAVSAPDLTPVRNDIGINGQETWASLLSVLLAMWGEGGNTLESLAYNLGVIQSAHNYTLESVMDAIAAIPAADLSAVLAKLDVIQPDEDDDLSTIASDIASVNTIVSGIATSLGNYRTGSNYTVQDILDRLDDLEAKIDAIQVGGAPVWPGLANVNMGAPVALVDQLVLNGPMDGVIVAVTTPPVGLGQYRVGGRRLDYGQMRLAFETDNGELEGWQYFGFEEAVYTPHAMAQAAKCRFQLLGGLGGTVTPWTRS